MIISRRCKPKEASVSARNSIDLDKDPCSIIGTRVFDAPRELVFSAFSDPEASGAMVGSGRLHHHHQRLRVPAGRNLALRHARPGRARLPEPRHYDEIVPPEKLVYRHSGGDDVEPVQFTQSLTFEDLAAEDPAHLARDIPVGGRARPRHQGIRRRQGLGADHGAAGRLRGGEGEIAMFRGRAVILRSFPRTRESTVKN